MSDAFSEAFGVTPTALAAYLLLHLHLHFIGRRLTRVEATPTVAAELSSTR